MTDNFCVERPQQAIDIGHCHTLPQSAYKGMVNAQVACDVWMAKMVREHGTQGLILLAGNGQVRKDIGVYHWLSSAERARTQVISYIEDASDESRRPDASISDRTIRLEPFERGDPCEAFTGKKKVLT
jgi:uncharacterized iron-regulated protein